MNISPKNTYMTKILIDSDVIIDLFLDREPFANQSEHIFEKLAADRVQGYVTAVALLNIYYIVRKTLGRDMALDCLQRLLETDGLEILAVDKEHVRAALDAGMTDFEDAVQAVTAQFAGIDMIVTRNIRDFRNAPIPALTPEELLQKIV